MAITGTGFSGQVTNVSAVDFGSAAAGFTVNSSTSITASAPVGRTAGHGRHHGDHGRRHERHQYTDQFTYVAAPTVTAVTPAAGRRPQAVVTITGTGFPGQASPTPAPSTSALTAAGFVVNSPTSITATAPAGTAGPVDITVTNLAGTERHQRRRQVHLRGRPRP